MDCIIWGAGKRGEECLVGIQSIESSLRISAFVDNNPLMWGKMLCGLPILSPDDFKHAKFDIVIICSKQGVNAIKKQLIDTLGVPESKIIRYRMDTLPVRFEAQAENVYLAQLGEFGYEMISWLPYLAYLKAQGIKLKTVGRKGSKVFYENISEEHIEVDDKYVGAQSMGELKKLQALKNDLGLEIFGPCNEYMGFAFYVNGIEWQVHDIHAKYPVDHIKKPEFSPQNILGIKDRKNCFRGIVTINNKAYQNTFYAGLVRNYFTRDEVELIIRFLTKKGYFVIYNDFSSAFINTSDPHDLYLNFPEFARDNDNVLFLQDYSDGTEDKWDRMQLECWQNSNFVIQTPGGAAAVVELLGVRKFNFMQRGDYQDDLYLSKIYGGKSDTFYEVRHMLVYLEKEMELGRL